MEHVQFSTLDLLGLGLAAVLSMVWLWVSELREWRGGRK